MAASAYAAFRLAKLVRCCLEHLNLFPVRGAVTHAGDVDVDIASKVANTLHSTNRSAAPEFSRPRQFTLRVDHSNRSVIPQCIHIFVQPGIDMVQLKEVITPERL